jgi:hypothetical protein
MVFGCTVGITSPSADKGKDIGESAFYDDIYFYWNY